MDQDAAPELTQAPAPAFLLSELLMQLFTPEESRRFLGKYYQNLLFAVPHDSVPQAFFDELSLLLFRHGLVNLQLYKNLISDRPAQERLILNKALEMYPRGGFAPSIGRGEPVVDMEVVFRGSLEDFDMKQVVSFFKIVKALGRGSCSVILRVKSGSIQVFLRLGYRYREYLDGEGTHILFKTLRDGGIDVEYLGSAAVTDEERKDYDELRKMLQAADASAKAGEGKEIA